MNSRNSAVIPELSNVNRLANLGNGRTQPTLRHTGPLNIMNSNEAIRENDLKGRLSTFFSHRDPLAENPPTMVHSPEPQTPIEHSFSLRQERAIPELPGASSVLQELPDSPVLGRYEMRATHIERPKTKGNGYFELMSRELSQGQVSQSPWDSKISLSWEETKAKNVAREEIKRIQALDEFRSVEEIEIAYTERITALQMEFNCLAQCDRGCISNCVTCTTRNILYVQLEDLLNMRANDIEYFNSRQMSENSLELMGGGREMEVKLPGIMRLESRSRLAKTWINAARNDLVHATEVGKKALEECRGLKDERDTEERCKALFEEIITMVEETLSTDKKVIKELDDVEMKAEPVADTKESSTVFKWWANRER